MGCSVSYFCQHKPIIKVIKSKLENFNACFRERIVPVWLSAAKWMNVKKRLVLTKRKSSVLFKGGGDVLLFLL